MCQQYHSVKDVSEKKVYSRKNTKTFAVNSDLYGTPQIVPENLKNEGVLEFIKNPSNITMKKGAT